MQIVRRHSMGQKRRLCWRKPRVKIAFICCLCGWRTSGHPQGLGSRLSRACRKDVGAEGLEVGHLTVDAKDAALKRIPHVCTHFSSSFMSACSWRWSWWLVIGLQRRQSSANRCTWDFTADGKSLMWHRNRMGPSTVPCGTLESTGSSADYSPSTSTFIFLLVRKFLSQQCRFPPIPQLLNLCRNLEWGTVERHFRPSKTSSIIDDHRTTDTTVY